nr:hypothetical protein [Tanacetum cinerariifolium]
EPSVDIKDSPKQGRMIEELDKDEDVNLVSDRGEVHETAELSKDDHDATLVETLLNIKRSGSPRCQETIGGNSTQTKSVRVLEQPNEPPLIEGHTSRTEEGRMENIVELTDTVPPIPYDSPLTRGYTPESDEEPFSSVNNFMADLKFVDQHSMVAYLEKSDDNTEFHQIVDFFSSCSITMLFLIPKLFNIKSIDNGTYRKSIVIEHEERKSTI